MNDLALLQLLGIHKSSQKGQHISSVHSAMITETVKINHVINLKHRNKKNKCNQQIQKASRINRWNITPNCKQKLWYNTSIATTEVKCYRLYHFNQDHPHLTLTEKGFTHFLISIFISMYFLISIVITVHKLIQISITQFRTSLVL